MGQKGSAGAGLCVAPQAPCYLQVAYFYFIHMDNQSTSGSIKKPFWQQLWFLVPMAVLLLIIVSAANSLEKTSDQYSGPVQAMVFDLPPLIGKTIDEVVTALGEPTAEEEPTAEQKKVGYTEGTVSYEHEGITLMVNFDVLTRKVNDFYVSPPGIEPVQNITALLQAANLREETTDSYVVSSVSAGDKKDAGYSGIVVITKEDAERKNTIQKQFSAWDGSHIKLTRVIKDSMHDPDSYEHVKTTYVDKSDHLIVTTTFRGTNAFGGKISNTVSAKVSVQGDVIEILE